MLWRRDVHACPTQAVGCKVFDTYGKETTTIDEELSRCKRELTWAKTAACREGVFPDDLILEDHRRKLQTIEAERIKQQEAEKAAERLRRREEARALLAKWPSPSIVPTTTSDKMPSQAVLVRAKPVCDKDFFFSSWCGLCLSIRLY